MPNNNQRRPRSEEEDPEQAQEGLLGALEQLDRAAARVRQLVYRIRPMLRENDTEDQEGQQRKKGGPSVDSFGAEAIEGWVLSFAFDSFDAAGPVYERARDLIFGHDVDASVYRIVLNGQTHVVALGFMRMPNRVEEQLVSILAEGTNSILPEEVLLALSLRHADVRGPGMKYERRGTRPPTVTFD